MPMLLTATVAEGTVAAIDFTDAFTAALTNIQTAFVALAGVAIGIGLGIWGAPKGVQLVKKFFNSLTH